MAYEVQSVRYGTELEDRHIVDAFKRWATAFDDPDAPVIRSIRGLSLSARQIAEEVAQHTTIGMNQVKSLRRTAESQHVPLETVLHGMLAATREQRTL
jgi:hypothetical protein